MTKSKAISLKKKIETHYDGRELLCFDNRPNDFLEIFKDVVKRHPNRTALFFKDRAVSYKKLDELSDGFAKGLLKSGLKEKNILVINVANNIEFVVALLSSFKIGLIAMPVGHRHKKEELSSLYEDAPWVFVANWKQNAVTSDKVNNFSLQPSFFLILKDVTK